MPAYNAVRTLRQTCAELPREVVDEILVVDDHSSDATVQLARELHLTTFVHHQNLGYGRNQKTCYREALRRGADIVRVPPPDQYFPPPRLPPRAQLDPCWGVLFLRLFGFGGGGGGAGG